MTRFILNFVSFVPLIKDAEKAENYLIKTYKLKKH